MSSETKREFGSTKPGVVMVSCESPDMGANNKAQVPLQEQVLSFCGDISPGSGVPIINTTHILLAFVICCFIVDTHQALSSSCNISPNWQDIAIGESQYDPLPLIVHNSSSVMFIPMNYSLRLPTLLSSATKAVITPLLAPETLVYSC